MRVSTIRSGSPTCIRHAPAGDLPGAVPNPPRHPRHAAIRARDERRALETSSFLRMASGSRISRLEPDQPVACSCGASIATRIRATAAELTPHAPRRAFARILVPSLSQRIRDAARMLRGPGPASEGRAPRHVHGSRQHAPDGKGQWRVVPASGNNRFNAVDLACWTSATGRAPLSAAGVDGQVRCARSAPGRRRVARPGRGLQPEDNTNTLPSGSLNFAKVPQGCFVGGSTNSTPRCDNWRCVASTLSHCSEPLKNVPMRSS